MQASKPQSENARPNAKEAEFSELGIPTINISDRPDKQKGISQRLTSRCSCLALYWIWALHNDCMPTRFSEPVLRPMNLPALPMPKEQTACRHRMPGRLLQISSK